MPSRTKFTLGDLRLVHSEKNDGPITGFIHTLVRDPKNGTNFEYKDIHISNFEIEPGQVKTFIASAPMWGDKIGSWYIDGIVYKSTSGNFYNLPGNGFLQTQSFTVSNTGVWLFQGLRYEGIGERFSSNDPNLSNNRIDNDTTTSIKIYTGWYTVVCKNQSYGGRCEFFASSDNDLRNNIVGSNTISSIVVLKNWMFIKGSTATIYIIENGQKRGIPSWEEYLCLGGQPGGYITLLDTIVSLIPTGPIKHCP